MGQTLNSKGAAALFIGVSIAALAACTPPHPKPSTGESLRTVSTLDCPDNQGDLKLQTKAGDGQSCAYASGDGDQVTLKLISVPAGDVKAALAPIETQVKAALPQLNTAAKESGNTGGGADKDWKQGDHDKDNVDLDLPGIHIHSHGDGHANIDTVGVHVTADGDGDKGDGNAHVVVAGGSHGGVTVDAHDGGAQIRVTDSGPGVRQTFILESDTSGPQGFRVSGYDARGPSAGPLVVATILAKEKGGDGLRHDVRALLKLNVGG
jgi:hypothetical protein